MFKESTSKNFMDNNFKSHKRKKPKFDDTRSSASTSKRFALSDKICDESANEQCIKNQNSAEITLLEQCREPSPIVLADWLQTFKLMPKTVQADALSDLVDLCSSSQVKHLQHIIAPHFQKDFVNFLPKELSLKIVNYLSPEDLISAAQISSSWRQLTEDNLLWAQKCYHQGIIELQPPNNGRLFNWQVIAEKRRQLSEDLTGASPPISFLELTSVEEEADPFFCHAHFRQPFGSRTKVLSQMDLGPPSAGGPSTSAWTPCTRRIKPNFSSFSAMLDGENICKALKSCVARSKWKAIYLRDRRIHNNWRRRRVNAACELRGHDEHVITCMQITMVGHVGERVVTGSDDHTLRVWSAVTAECERVLTGHSGGVWALQLSDDGRTVISGSTDRTVRVWNIEDGRCIHVLNGHTSTVRCMALKGNILVSGSRDCTVQIWDIHEGRAVRTLHGHLAAVRCVQFDGVKIISGGYDHNLIVWDANTGAQIHVLTGHASRVYSLLYESERGLAVSGSLDTTIRVWDVNTGDCLQTLVGHQSLTSGMQLRGNMLVSANADSTIKVWNILDGQCTHTLAGPHRHSSAVTSLQILQNGFVVSSGDDGTVKLWDVEQGSFLCDLLKLEAGGTGGCVWRIIATPTMLICAVGSRNSTEDTKLIMMDFDAPYP